MRTNFLLILSTFGMGTARAGPQGRLGEAAGSGSGTGRTAQSGGTEAARLAAEARAAEAARVAETKAAEAAEASLKISNEHNKYIENNLKAPVRGDKQNLVSWTYDRVMHNRAVKKYREVIRSDRDRGLITRDHYGSLKDAVKAQKKAVDRSRIDQSIDGIKTGSVFVGSTLKTAIFVVGLATVITVIVALTEGDLKSSNKNQSFLDDSAEQAQEGLNGGSGDFVDSVGEETVTGELCDAIYEECNGTK